MCFSFDLPDCLSMQGIFSVDAPVCLSLLFICLFVDRGVCLSMMFICLPIDCLSACLLLLICLPFNIHVCLSTLPPCLPFDLTACQSMMSSLYRSTYPTCLLVYAVRLSTRLPLRIPVYPSLHIFACRPSFLRCPSLHLSAYLSARLCCHLYFFFILLNGVIGWSIRRAGGPSRHNRPLTVPTCILSLPGQVQYS
jgi:hypothetical protein